MRIPRSIVAALAGATLISACGVDTVVTSQRADQIATGDPAEPAIEPGPVIEPPPPATSSTDSDETAGSATDDPTTTDAPTSVPPETSPAPPTETEDVPRAEPDLTSIDFGPDKPPQDYDALLLATMTDLEAWWTAQYPLVYGEPFVPLQGSVYAAYPARPDDVPGCGAPRTTYNEVQQYVAFYCGDGDFIVYDDGDGGVLSDLADAFGPSTLSIVLAHEYGHAIQLRSQVLERDLPTIATEQQADCMAGAWAGRAARGESPYIRFSDDDVRSGLIAMLEVRDPVGVDQFTPGGHGSGFDRVGAFQVGFTEGLDRCGSLIDDPLPLTPNQFTSRDEVQTGGNAPFGFGDDELLGFLPEDLNLYWAEELDSVVPNFDGLTLVAVQDRAQAVCDDLRGDLGDGAAVCPSTGTVYLNEPVARNLYGEATTFGDFSVGYLLGAAWAEAVQDALGSPLNGEARALRNDCLTGAWVSSVIPVDFQLPQPRLEERTSVASPGDLDEAIRTLILVGDDDTDDDRKGTPFEKIDAFRSGVLGGLSACDV